MKTVIIGGGSAGVSAATHLRRTDENAEIIIIEKSNEFAVSSCGLPYVLAGKIKEKDDIVGATVSQMQRIFQIEVMLNTEVLTIDAQRKLLHLSDEKKINYDKLIIATGAIQLRPDIAGILSDNIFTLNSLKSAQRIVDYFVSLNAKKVIILGGGYIGLRTAEALIHNKADVTLIENHSHILSNFDYDFASMVKQKLETKGISILTNTTVKEFLADKVILGNGDKLKYDMAIIATGNKSSVRLPIITDIEIGQSGGIIVDEYMRTSVDDILACGENIELPDLITTKPRRMDDASLIVRSAKTAADNALGIESKMSFGLRNHIVKVFDYVIGICGCNEDELKQAGIAYHKLYFAQKSGEIYLKSSRNLNCKLLFGLDGQILGFQIMGRTGVNARLNTMAAIMAHKGTIQELAEFPTAYFPEFTKAKDLLNNLGTLAIQIAFEKMKVLSLGELCEKDILLNVCMPSNFRHFSKAKAINIPLAALRRNLSEIPRNKKVVLACSTGYAAYIAYCILSQRGFNQVFLLNSPEVWQ